MTTSPVVVNVDVATERLDVAVRLARLDERDYVIRD
jgi:hypothetical protein